MEITRSALQRILRNSETLIRRPVEVALCFLLLQHFEFSSMSPLPLLKGTALRKVCKNALLSGVSLRKKNAENWKCRVIFASVQKNFSSKYFSNLKFWSIFTLRFGFVKKGLSVFERVKSCCSCSGHLMT